MPKKALITGLTGQDGSHLAEHLLDSGYEVHGIHPASLESHPSMVHGDIHQLEQSAAALVQRA